RVRGHRGRDAHPARARRVPGHPEERRLHPDREEESARPVCPDQEPALARHPGRRPPAPPRARPRGVAHDQDCHRRGRPGVPARSPGHRHHPPRPAPLSVGSWRTVTAYGITSLTVTQASPADLARWIRGHWGIEALHHIRDVTYGEDASQVRTRNGPQVMATLRNLTIGIMKMAGHPNIAAATRYHARDATRTLATLGLSPAAPKAPPDRYAGARPRGPCGPYARLRHPAPMTQEQFVAVIKQVVFDPAVSEMVLQPAGREPHQVPVRMWDWYTGLPGPDKAMVQHAMRIAAYGAIFHFFAALDGSAAIDDPAARPAAA